MKTCPICGHTGETDVCPKDGARLLTAEELHAANATQVGEPLMALAENATRAQPMPAALMPAPVSEPEDNATRAQAVPAALRPPPPPPGHPAASHPDASQPVPVSLDAAGDADPSTAQPVKTGVTGVVSTQAQQAVQTSGRRHPTAAQQAVSHKKMRGKNFGKWAEPKVRKKKKDPMIGRTIAGRYEVIGLLGKGGMGAVYKARQPAVQRMIALKVLLQEFAENETVIRRFHQEALAASRLEHPNTIRVYDFGQTDDGILFIAMEYLRGQSLAQAQARGSVMSPKRVVYIMHQVCKSLAEAHKAGIIHRDLKPDNIFLVDIEGERDFAKVLDFGVAKLKEFEGNEGTLTQAGMIFGTPKYMSPEQARSGDLDARSDVYALGVMLYEMITGRAPFVGENPLAILIAHVNEAPPAFFDVNPNVDVPPALEAVVFKALAKNREHRHANVEELLRELEAVDKLLDGASYESVAAALPGILPGADGSPSMVGPAILPQGSDETQGGVVQPSGNTVRLDGDGNPMAVAFDAAPVVLDAPDERESNKSALWVLLLALPILGLGIWFFTQGTGDPVVVPIDAPQTIASAEPTALPSDSDVAPGTQPAAVASEASASGGSDAPASTAVASAPSAAKVVTFKIRTSPKNVQIKDLETNEVVGTTPALVDVSRTTTFVLTKTNYYAMRIELDPAKGLPDKPFRLKPKPVAEPIKPVAPVTRAVTVRKQPVTPVRVKPATVKTAAPDDIDLQ